MTAFLPAALCALVAAYFWVYHAFVLTGAIRLSLDTASKMKGEPPLLILFTLLLAALFATLFRLSGIHRDHGKLFSATLLAAAVPLPVALYGHNGALFSLPLHAAVLFYLTRPAVRPLRLFARAERFVRRHQRWLPWLLAALAFGWFFGFSYYRYLSFAAGSKDLGLFSQTIYLLSRGLSPDNTVMGRNAFGDHAEFIDLLIVPFVWLWKSPGALLLAQSLAVASGLVPLYRFARRKLGSATLALICALIYPSLFGLQAAVMYDFNPETIAAGFLPWLFHLADRRRWGLLAIPLLLLALCKENFLLFGATFGLFLMAYYRALRVGATVFLLSAGLFALEILFVFPHFAAGGFRHLREKGFGIVGNSFGDILKTALTNPTKLLTVLLSPGQKTTHMVHPFATLAFVPLLFPWLLLLVGTMLATRYLSTFPNSWTGYFYGAPEETVLLICLIYAAARFPGRWRRRLIAVAAATLALFIAFQPIQSADLYRLTHHYYPQSERQAVYREMLALIPADAPVIAQNYLLPSLSMREKIYLFEPAAPFGTVDYVALDRNGSQWPNGAEDYRKTLKRVEQDTRYERIFARGGAALYRLRPGAPTDTSAPPQP